MTTSDSEGNKGNPVQRTTVESMIIIEPQTSFADCRMSNLEIEVKIYANRRLNLIFN